MIRVVGVHRRVYTVSAISRRWKSIISEWNKFLISISIHKFQRSAKQMEHGIELTGHNRDRIVYLTANDSTITTH